MHSRRLRKRRMRMKLLAVETATENCSAAVYVDGEITGVSELAPQKHAELILPMTDLVLKQAGISKQDLDGIVFGKGPGSFTGVRIAASTAQGLALGLNLRCAGVSSLEALAMQALMGTD
ncbi:MAG TPA: tRNA (adenosine(37)-N6)-threonylcarbamoyltransferase complex dimerization subunit type 1 TsaB [Succinivibrionaceae bacterium]|nr:tRNA (adenosine(37)-N6)-threonylcarbamoyltransferase complex dimerization subunit type 1 TsaB [Succinivibrionaceae bacterium]